MTKRKSSARKGTIYRETYSKGTRNGQQRRCSRWCVEVTVDHTRYRKRFGRFCQAVKWLMQQRSGLDAKVRHERIRRMAEAGTLQPIVGYDGYYVNAKRRMIYTDRRCPMVVASKNRLGVDTAFVGNDCMSINRLLLAVKYGIGYRDIPRDLIAVCRDGQVTVSTVGINLSARKKELKMRKRNEIVAQYVDELLMLQRFYQTGDDKELVAYMQQRRNLLINIYYRRYHHKTDISLLYDAAVERTLARLKMPDTIIRDVSGALLSTMRTIRHERKGNRVFNERVM